MRPPFVYFVKPIGADGPIKIGCSQNPMGRLNDLLNWSPLELEMLGTIPGSVSLERNIHECFRDAHSHKEWFHPIPRLVAAIEQIQAGVPVDQAIDLNDRKGRLPYLNGTDKKFTPERSLYFSYAQRAWRAEERARKITGYFMRLPNDAAEVMDKWRDDRDFIPSAEQIERLETVLAEPAVHCVSRYPEPSEVSR